MAPMIYEVPWRWPLIPLCFCASMRSDRVGALLLLRMVVGAALAAVTQACVALKTATGNTTDHTAAAVRAFEAHDVGESRRRYDAVLVSAQASAEQRGTAHRALANFDWKFRRSRAAAVLHLSEAVRSAESGLNSLYTQQGSIQYETGRVAKSCAAAVLTIATVALRSDSFQHQAT